MAIAKPRAKRIPEWKKREVEELSNLIRKYKCILIADISKTTTAQLQKIKRKLSQKWRDKLTLRVAKNTLFRLALEKVGINSSMFEKYLTGTNLFIFTELNPFEIALELEKTYVTAPAKPGMKTETEIVLPAGDTGFKPGPIMSLFGRLKIPIRTQGGTIWIVKDTRVAKPGDTISPEVASILQKLGIEPMIVKLKPKVAFEDSIIIPADKLKLDLNEYKDQIQNAIRNALWVGVEIAYPSPQVLELALPVAVRRAIAVASESGYITPETAEYVVSTAVRKAHALILAMGDYARELGVEIYTQPSKVETTDKKEEEEEKEEEEKVSEEQLAAGLESLFG